MENQNIRDDRPYRPEDEPSGVPTWAWLLIAALVAAGVGYYVWRQWNEGRPVTPPVAATKPAVKGAPEIRYPVREEEPEKPLPPVEESDALMRELATALVDPRVFDALVEPNQLIRRIVATVDNLPRQEAPVAKRPLKPVPGAFIPGPANAARYAAYVRVAEAIDARALVQRYAKAYPLFQQAYVELGFPGRYFNDRLVEAIDDLLAAPELASPPALVQPKVLYQYADAQLEARSAGQKIMMRMGGAHAARLKAKLREIRAELVALKP